MSTDINRAFDWLKKRGFVQKADEGGHIGFDGLVEKLMAKGYSKESATKIAGKVYWEQQGGGGGKAAKADASTTDEMKAQIDTLVEELVEKGYSPEMAMEIAGKVFWGNKADTGGVQLESETNIKEEDWPFSPTDTTPEKEHMIGCLRWAIEDQGMESDKAVEVCTGMWPSSGPWSIPANPA